MFETTKNDSSISSLSDISKSDTDNSFENLSATGAKRKKSQKRKSSVIDDASQDTKQNSDIREKKSDAPRKRKRRTDKDASENANLITATSTKSAAKSSNASNRDSLKSKSSVKSDFVQCQRLTYDLINKEVIISDTILL